METNIKGKVALVTGGSHGLGKAICAALAAEGAKVAVNYYRNEKEGVDLVDSANEVVAEIKKQHDVEAIAVPSDVADEADVLAMFETIKEQLGPIDILVNNAAVCPTCQVRDMTVDVWRRTLDVNLTGTFLTSREFVKDLLDNDRTGKVVNIASQAAFRGSTTGHAPYDASKGGIVSFTIALAREVAAKGINVNAVAPGMIYTDMTKKTIDNNREKYLARIPLNRIATPEEVAATVVFLASDGASYMTGATLDVTGGMLMR